MKSLNHIYRTIWSEALGVWVAVSEIAKSNGKRSGASRLREICISGVSEVGNDIHRHRLKPLLIALACGFAFNAHANPIGGQVVNGNASFNTSGNTLTVTNTPGTIINWQGFSIAANEATHFAQQSAASTVLNRVVTNNPSAILGTLSSNGQVYLVNANGIVFGAGATVDVAGLVATTLNLSNADFLAGNHHYTAVPGAQNIGNAGNLNAQSGGHIYLIAPNVENTGIITAANGEILLAAGSEVQLVNSKDSALRVSIIAPAGDATNLGKLIAQAGNLGLFGTVVKNSGTVSADSATLQSGSIVFKASQNVVLETGSTTTANSSAANGGSINAIAQGAVINGGSVQANGVNGGNINLNAGTGILQYGSINADGSNQGGAITARANTRILQTGGGSVTANGAYGGTVDLRTGTADAGSGLILSGLLQANGTQQGGNVVLTGSNLDLLAADVQATGGLVGGNISIGGGFQGKDATIANATITNINAATHINASATNGDGGNVVVWSDNQTTFSGNIDATGGLFATRGGQVEVSGKNLGFNGLVNASTLNGLSGNLLLDPANIIIQAVVGPTPAFQLAKTGTLVQLGNGNLVVANSADSTVATSSGAVWLFDGTTGALISTLTGSTANDLVGLNGVIALTNGNFVVNSTQWNNGAATFAGAVTWGSGTAGVSGTVSTGNSLVGSTANDSVGIGGITVLANGNYVVNSNQWNNGAVLAAGAVTWGSGTTGVSGTVSALNSLVGSTANDNVGNAGITVLTNGNYVVSSTAWNNGAATSAGAVTWGDKLGGTVGVVSAANSLVGTTVNDQVGNGGITALTNGNYVVNSWMWNNGAATIAGAATWGNGVAGTVGAVSTANSLVGSTANDRVGVGGIIALTNGNYVVSSSVWNNGAATFAGAVTWGDGSTAIGGITGTVSAANSLVGSTANDQVGLGGITALTNGNYVVSSWAWNNGAARAVGAVTWGDGALGTAGAVSTANSLVGGTANDLVGKGGTTALTNGNYVVNSSAWNGGMGAATWGNGATGTTGVVLAGNSLVGSTANDGVGSGGITALTNGNYVVNSSAWNNGAANSAGAVTWGNGVTGTTGAVSAANSLVGSTANDGVGNGGITALTNGNYVVNSSLWNGGMGAATWGGGTTGVSGTVSATNSLVGSTANDGVGNGGITALSNGNYVVTSSAWNGGMGAVTWGSGTTGVSGTVSATNSLVGSTANDGVGNGGITALTNGNYVVNSLVLNGGIGAVTWGNGTGGTTGAVSTANSVVGVTVASQALTGGRYAAQTAAGWGVYDPALALANPMAYGALPGQTGMIASSAITAITNTGTAVTLQASNDITVNSAIITVPNGGVTTGGNLNLSAGRSIRVNANIDLAGGTLNLLANDTVANGVVATDRLPGAAVIDTSLAGITAGAVNMDNSGGAINVGSVNASGAVALSAGGAITQTGAISTAGTVSVQGNSYSNNTGSATPITASNARIFTAGPAADNYGGMTAAKTLYGCTGLNNCASAVPNTGVVFMYAQAPAPATPVVASAISNSMLSAMVETTLAYGEQSTGSTSAGLTGKKSRQASGKGGPDANARAADAPEAVPTLACQ